MAVSSLPTRMLTMLLIYRMRIPLPPPDAPLSALRAAIQERTGVAPEHQKLIVGGAIMQKGNVVSFPIVASWLQIPGQWT